MIIRTDALVLRHMDFRETSRIVTLFTRSHGKVSVLAKGARQMKSRFGSALEPMAYIQAVFYHKPTRSLQTITEASHLHLFPRLRASLGTLTLGLRMVELTHALSHDEQPNPMLFNLLLQALHQLDEADAAMAERLPNLLAYFQLRLATSLGFAAAVSREQLSALPDGGGVLTLDSGAAHPQGFQGRRASRQALRAFGICARADLDDVMRMHLTPAVRRELDALVEAYLRYHVEDAYPTRGEAVIEQLSQQTRGGA